MATNDDENNAEAFDEDLLVEEGADDTDVSSQFPPDHYEAVFEPTMTEAGEARTETIQERVLREETDPVVEELDRNAEAEQAEDEAYAHRRPADPTQGLVGDDSADIDAQLAELDDAAIEAGTDGTDGDRLDVADPDPDPDGSDSDDAGGPS